MEAQINQTDIGAGSNESLTFEKVWSSIMELRKRQEETARQQEETARQQKETDRQIGKLGNRFGELVEHLVVPGIMDKFNEQGFNFSRCSESVKLREPDSKGVCTEIDLMLENGEIVVAIEVKSKPSQADVDRHAWRMEVLRRTDIQQKDKRKYQGAIAGAIINQELRNYILKSGFYVIEQTGDTVKLTIPEGFVPREW